MKTNQKKLVYRVVFYLLFWLLLLAIPIIYERYFMDCGIDMLLFFSLQYSVCKLIAIISIVFLAEYWLFAKLRVEIKEKKMRLKLAGWLIAILFFSTF